MARVLAIDLGAARIGLAVSDPEGLVAQPLDVIPNDDDALDAIATIEADEFVVGLPVRMNGTRGPEADAAEAFAETLRTRTAKTVTLWDERLSTVEAERTMRSGGTRAKQQRGRVDKVAAAVFLQSFLESRRR
jgi:putative Holliday junction resolvase